MRFSRAGSTQFSICPLKLAGWIARYMSKSIPTPLCTAVSADDSQAGESSAAVQEISCRDTDET